MRDDLYDIGVVAQVVQMLKLPDGTVRVLVEGTARATLEHMREEGGLVVASVTMDEVQTAAGSEVGALMRSVSRPVRRICEAQQENG